MSLYPHPFSAGYWRDAFAELKDLRKLVFAALMIAMCMVLSLIPSAPLFGGAKITWGFLARSVCALVCGPVLGVLFGFAEDILSFFVTGGGGYPFFPGYTLTTMLGVLIYALFFYRARLTVRRVFLAKLLTNIENVVLGALWMAILSGKAWYVTASGSAIKNLICLPFQTLVLVVLFAALMPALRQLRLAPRELEGKIRW
nr:folate family ECF transporter S component [uncultured Oscillibacter sp.]